MSPAAPARVGVALAALLPVVGVAAGTLAQEPAQALDTTTSASADAPTMADSAAPDSRVPATPVSDTAPASARPAIRHAARESEKDTATLALAPLWGLDVAWTLGSAPEFELWQKALPRSLADLSLPAYVHGVDGPGDADSARLRFELKDEPNTYNVDFPLGLSWAFLSRGLHGLSVHCAFAFQRKHASAILRADSVAGKLTLEHSLALTSLGAGLTYTLGIPEKYFSVDNTRRTALVAGVAVDPLTYLRRRETLDAQGGTDDSLGAAGQTVSAGLHEFSAYGLGLSWTVGVSSIKKLSENGGLVTTVAYQGRWQRFAGVVEDDLRYVGRSEGTPVLSYVCHRFALMLSLVRGRKQKVEEASAPSQSESPALPAPESGSEAVGTPGTDTPAQEPSSPEDVVPGREQ